ncbi:MAG: gliding motility-associated ABC transporter substrate-binding protein GldG [Capnocytophaga sp.]|nr:gliding motility-associated ABC transporter substrate-binding protein GldG [Capnocytophaga sp.]
MNTQLKHSVIKISLALLCVIGFNMLASHWNFRWDLTKDKRYTLSQTTREVLADIHTPVLIDVLLKGDIPSDFLKLQTETRQLLDEYTSINNKIRFNFVNPLEGETNTEQALAELSQFGLSPLQIAQSEAGKASVAYIFPWAMVSDGERSEKVPLFVNKLGATEQERIQYSVERLEYHFTDALRKLILQKDKKIAVLKSNGTLDDIYIADFLQTIQTYYRVAPFTLDSAATNPAKTLQQLSEFDLLLVAKPTLPFSDEQKQIIDQYVMQGGKLLWLMDAVNIAIEDLYNPTGTAMAMPMNLNVGDLFFPYGIRFNYNLINDLYFTQIVIATGEGSQTRYTPIPWVYNPMLLSKNNTLINNNLDAMRMQFANSIDTLANGIKKTILLSSSELSKMDGVPREISLNADPNKLDKNGYLHGNIPTAVLLEGEFTSMYKNRVTPIDLPSQKEQSVPTKMILLSDGDFIRNDISNNAPLELGYDKWTNNFYDNKAFLLNSLNYLFDETGLLALRNKKVQLAFLDKEKVAETQNSWKVKSLLIPLLILMLIGIGTHFWYKKTFSR